MRALMAYFSAVIVTYLLAAVAATQHVVGQLTTMGAPLSLAERLAMTGHDILGMRMFLALIAVGLLIGFLVAGLLGRWLPRGRGVLFPLAGFVAVITIHIALELSFGLTPIAASREWPGLLLQGCCGAIGGWLFSRIKPIHVGRRV